MVVVLKEEDGGGGKSWCEEETRCMWEECWLISWCSSGGGGGDEKGSKTLSGQIKTTRNGGVCLNSFKVGVLVVVVAVVAMRFEV
ncbi:hypothetical protein FF1_002637 [Malus domestica]